MEPLPEPAATAATSLAYSFDDPREAQIHERLARIGAGPAAFWRDACFLTHNPALLITSVHMIGHALREMESAVRRVLRVTLNTDGEGHKAEVEAILTALGIPLDDPAALAWLGIPGEAGMQAWAHRKHLGLRQPDDEFAALWANVVAALDAALEAFDAASITALDRLDALLAEDPPTSAEISSFMEEIPKSVVVLDHFAENAPPSWLQPLRANGFLADIPQTTSLAESDGLDQLRWPISRYLLRLADMPPHKADATAAALELAELSNPYLHLDLVDIALLAEPHLAAQFAPHARTWLELNPSFLLVDRLAKLSAQLVDAGEVDAGFLITELLTDLETRG
jgi:hypothetical protein